LVKHKTKESFAEGAATEANCNFTSHWPFDIAAETIEDDYNIACKETMPCAALTRRVHQPTAYYHSTA